MSASVSATARLVAAGVAFEARLADTARVALAPRLARACLARDTGGRRLLRLIDSRLGRASLGVLQALTLPGITAHYGWRKRAIARWAQARVAAGFRQVLVLGSGWDALGTELAWGAHAPLVVEVDTPATLAVKRSALAALGLDTHNLKLVDADLAREDLGPLLDALPDLRRDLPTLVVAEGLVMYLERSRIAALADSLRRRAHAELRVIATAMSCDVHWHPGFRRQRPWVRWWLNRVGEPFLWGVERSDLPAALARLGFELAELAPPEAPSDPDPSPGEWVFQARAASDRSTPTISTFLRRAPGSQQDTPPG